MLDNAVIDLLTSTEAEKVCSKMFLIYTRLKRADWKLYERSGVLGINSDGTRTAWEILCDLAGVASATLNKALKWMKEQRVIGYWAGRNGVGIRIFFNVAQNSIRQKNLRLVPTSSANAHTSANEAPFNDNHVVIDIQNSDKRCAAPTADAGVAPESSPKVETSPPATQVTLALVQPLNEINQRLQSLEQNLHQLENERDWLEKKGLPKAVRVAVAEASKMIGKNTKPDMYVGAHQPQPDIALPPFPKIEHNTFYAEKLATIAQHVNHESLTTWFEPLQVEETHAGTRIVAPDPVFFDWINNNYADVLERVGLNACEWEFTAKGKSSDAI